MKPDKGMIFFLILFALVIVVSIAFGSYDTITGAVPRAQTAMAIGTTATNWLETSMRWLVGMAIGGVCMGVGAAAFREASEAYKLWKRNAQSGRWSPGPGAQFQKQPSQQSTKWTLQDKLLLLLGGRFPPMNGPVTHNQPTQQDDDRLDIEM